MKSKQSFLPLLIATALLFNASCKSGKRSNFEILNFDYTRIDSTFDLHNQIDTFFTVELETRKDVIVANRGKVFYEDGKIFLFDDGWGKAWCFSRSGDFLFFPFAKGRGPKEIEMPESMYLDKQEKQLLFIDALKKSIHFIDLDGNYLKEVKVGLYMKDIARVSKDKFALLLSEPEESSILIASSDLKSFQKTKVVLDQYSSTISSGVDPFSYNSDGSATFAFGLYDTVLNISGGEITKKYFFDFGELAITEEVKAYNNRELFYMFLDRNSNMAGQIMLFNETSSYICFRFMYSPLTKNLYYFKNKNTEDVKMFSYVSLGGNIIKGSWFKKVGDWYLGVIPSPIENPVIGSDLSKAEVSLLNLIKNKKPESNPILIFYKLKS